MTDGEWRGAIGSTTLDRTVMDLQFFGSGDLPASGAGELVFRPNKKTDQRHDNDVEVNGDSTKESPQDVITIDDAKESEYVESDPIELTRSTHSLLFTEPINSLPFAFALVIVLVSYTCLFLACHNNMQDGSKGNLLNVPFGVAVDVRIAQYLSLVIGLLMEEEIPAALFLLRQVPKSSLRQTTPKLNYSRFVFTAIVRLLMGYAFLINMFLVVIQAKAVLDIFYDVIAIQFVQQLDDICFDLAKKDVFGKRMKRATMRRCFTVEYKKLPFARRRKLSVFVKVLYLVNLGALIVGMATINVKQVRGDFYCHSVSVYLGDHIWEGAVVYNNSNISKERMNLIFSYFNGEYTKNSTSSDGRPIYIEQNKYNSTPYLHKVPAQIRYCASEKAWVLMHPLIRKSSLIDYDEDCPWLLKSSESTEFDLLEVGGDWKIWTGTISNGADFQVFCSECKTEVDCNYHGQCVNKRCECYSSKLFEAGLEGYFGNSCQFKNPCLQIRGGKQDYFQYTVHVALMSLTLACLFSQRPKRYLANSLEEHGRENAVLFV